MESPLLCLSNQSSVNSSQTVFDRIKEEQPSTTDFTEIKDSPTSFTTSSAAVRIKSEDQAADHEYSGDTVQVLDISEEIKDINNSIESLKREHSHKSEDNKADAKKWAVKENKLEATKSTKKPKNTSKVPGAKPPGTVKSRGGGAHSHLVKKYKCQFCDKAFACGYSLTRHVRIHTGEQCYECDICGKVFTTRSSKIRHDRTHLTEGTYKCEFCNKLFKRPASLAEHQKEHTGQKPFSCELCGKSFTKRFQLNNHVKYHHPSSNAQEICELCGQGFDDKDLLVEHLREHVSEKSIFPNPSNKLEDYCELCGQSFSDKNLLVEHLKEHVAEKALQSDFVDSSNDLLDSGSAPSQIGDLVQFSVHPTGSTSQEYQNSDEHSPPAILLTSPDGTYLTDGEIVNSDPALESKLESNIIYVVGEDGTLQPQISYNLVSPTPDVSNTPPDFVNVPLPLNPSESDEPVLDIKLEDKGETPMDIADSTNSNPLYSQPIKTEPVDSLVISQVSSGSLVDNEEPNSSLVIAQADTTSLDSVKTNEESSSTPSLAEGQDILALACQEFLAEPVQILPDNTSDLQQQTSDTSGDLAWDSNSQGANMHYSEKKFHCDFCEKSFTQRNNLASHMRTHTGEKPFKCGHCDMAFSQRWSLTRHVRIHTGEKPFKCHWCDESFRLKGEKTEHEKARHTNERNEKIANAKLNGFGVDGNSSFNGGSLSVDMIEITPKTEMNSNYGENSSQSFLQTDDSDSKSDYDSIQSSHYGDGEVVTPSSVAMKVVAMDVKQESTSSQHFNSGSFGGNNGYSQHNENEIRFHYGNEEYAAIEMDASNSVAAVSGSDVIGVTSPLSPTAISLALPPMTSCVTMVSSPSMMVASPATGNTSAASPLPTTSAASPAAQPTSPVTLHTLTAVELPSRDAQEQQGLIHHCDFCEASFASRTELVQHYNAHTG